MPLTGKQELFCIAYMETMNATEAYKRSYGAAKMAAATINRKAHALIENGKITARLTELRAPAIAKAQVSLESHLDDLKRLRDIAEKAEKYGPAIQAEIARGKASGLYVEKTEHSGPGGGPIQNRVTVEYVGVNENPDSKGV